MNPLNNDRSQTEKWLRIAFWSVPALFCVLVHWYGLFAYFRADDFVWLQQHIRMDAGESVWSIIFTPAAHGTMRPFSERGVFLLLGMFFPDNPLPFRIVAFATQIGSIVLLSSIMWRITGSRAAGFFAPIIWMCNVNVALVMTWSSAYMQLMCGFFLLLAFHFLLRYIETGRRKYYWFQWAAFLFGFGAMETNFVYPALAASYLLFFERKHLRTIWPMFLVSAAYVALHMWIAPKQHTGPYSVHLDPASVLQTLQAYWKLALRPGPLHLFTDLAPRLPRLFATILSVLFVGFIGWSTWRKRWLPLVFLAWTLILLSPVLPLRDHISDYYLTLPAMGIGMFGAWALVSGWRGTTVFRATTVLVGAMFFILFAPGAHRATKWWYKSHRSRSRTWLRACVKFATRTLERLFC